MRESVFTPVGMLALDGTRATGSGSMYDPALLPKPIAVREVPGATTTAIVTEPQELVASYCATARELTDHGADMIVSNCGISMVFQSSVREASGAPTVMSSLLLLPVLSRIFGGPVGVLTYEENSMHDAALRAECGWQDDLDVVIADVRHLASWRALETSGKESLPEDAMRRDLVAVVSRLVAESSPRCILVECTAMLPFVDDIRAASGVPLFDIFGLIDLTRKEIQRATKR